MLSFSFDNPILSNFFTGKGHTIKFLQHLLDKTPNSITVKFLLSKELEDLTAFNELQIPERVITIELAKFNQSKGNYPKAIEIWEELLSSSEDLPPIYETIVRNLFDCYLKSNNIDNAISLYVNSFIANQFIVQKINCTEVHEIIRKNKFTNVTATIDLPLFYTLSKADENEIHIAYERFNRSLFIEKPSQLFSKETGIEKHKLILFYHLSCSTEIFKHSIFIE